MSSIISFFHTIWECAKMAFAAFVIGIQLFWLIGPLWIGAMVGMVLLGVVAWSLFVGVRGAIRVVRKAIANHREPVQTPVGKFAHPVEA